MQKDALPNIARNSLSDILGEPGGILYSSHETLKPGSVYLLGFNPGGSNGEPLDKSVQSLLTYSGNAYIDESWSNGLGSLAPGEAPLQRRIRWLLSQLGLDTASVCASNLIFVQSKAASDINFKLAEKCWPVHEAILEIVQPKMIITFGNSDYSAYGYLKAKFDGKEDCCICAGHGDWKLKGFNTRINGRTVYVAGLPHLSRYSPENKPHLIEWLSKIFKTASNA